MARANRHHIPGCVWHITHRCHKQECLLKFSKDRDRYLCWLYEAKKRFGLKILNYIVTSNHIHLLAIDTGKDVIPKSIQLIAGRTGQEYNQRKNRKGAFWEDRYHATAIDTDDHLFRCITYIDLNMVRAGKISNPSQWAASGYNEIQKPPERYSLIDRKSLMQLCGLAESGELTVVHKQWIEEALGINNYSERQSFWSESVAVGRKFFLEDIVQKLRGTKNWEIVNRGNNLTIREPNTSYSTLFDSKKDPLSSENSYFWDKYNE